MSDPNPEEFTYSLKERDYRVRLKVRGTMQLDVDAGSKEEAQRIAERMLPAICGEPLDIELDDVDDVSISYVIAPSRMYRVMRDGQKMQVSRLQTGDLPREADESGF